MFYLYLLPCVCAYPQSEADPACILNMENLFKVHT
jgi:hypothetical protein